MASEDFGGDVRRDTGYASAAAEAGRLPLSSRRRDALSPVQMELPSFQGQPSLTGSTSPPARQSSEEIQVEIDEVQRRIDELTTRKMPKLRHRRVMHGDTVARGLIDDYDPSDEVVGLPTGGVAESMTGSVGPGAKDSDGSRTGAGQRLVVRAAGTVTGQAAPDRALASVLTAGREQTSVVATSATPVYPASLPEGGSPVVEGSSPAVSSSRRTLPTIKLGTYDGSTPLETHLAKLENSASYYGWSAHDRLCHLKASLEGQAGQVLWQLEPGATEADVTRLLRNRFGNINQMERFRAELQSRRRRAGESIQSVYNDIRRLLALSFPGHSGELCEVIGRDAFLSALDDPALRVRVLDQSPSTLDQALAIVCRMEAYSATAEGAEVDLGRRKVRSVNATPVGDNVAAIGPQSSDKRLQQLESDLANQRREIRQLRADSECWKRRAEAAAAVSARHDVAPPPGVGQWSPPSQPSWNPQALPSQPPWSGQPPSVQFQSTGGPPVFAAGSYAAVGDAVQQQPPSLDSQPRPSYGRVVPRGRGRRSPRNRVDRDTCMTCGERGHWRNECPYRTPYDGSVINSDSSPANVTGVSAPCLQSETYLDIYVHGVKAQCLVDTGCDHSILPRRVVPSAVLGPSSTELYAANGSKIRVMGFMRLLFNVQGLSLHADFLVSDDVDECILGFDWLRRNNCHWLFDEGVLIISGERVKLQQRPSRASVRRIYARESVAVPDRMQVNVPVRMPLSSWRTPKADWVTETREVKPGLFAARTLLPDNDKFAAVRFINVSGEEQIIDSGYFLGRAVPGFQLGCGEMRSVAPASHGAVDDTSGTAARGVDNGPAAKPLVGGATQSCSEAFSPTAKPIGGRAPGINLVTAKPYTNPALSLGGDLPIADRGASYQSTQAATSAVLVDGCRTRTQTFCEDFADLLNGECAHIKPIVDGIPDEFSEGERRRVTELLINNADLFSRSEFDLGRTTLITHGIDTGQHRPIAQPLRRHAKVHLDVIDETVDKMVAAGIIEPASSPWASNVVVVARPGNPVPRITIDYRKLNEITYKDRFPLPRVADCLEALQKNVFFSTLDLSSSFNQVNLRPCDRDKTAFITRAGQFRWTTMPQGACNSPSVFSRLMSLVLKGLTPLYCLAFIDDVIVLGRSFDEHLSNLAAVFHRFRQANLKLKPSKAKLLQRRCKFLGHIVSEAGIEVDPAKVACVLSWPFPHSVSELRGFLGLCGYYRKFCPGFSARAEPLTEMLRKGAKVEETPRRTQAFNDLKGFLTTAPVLAMPDDEGEFVLDVDASLTNCAAVLQQWQNGDLRVIEYASRTFNKAERSYYVTRREMSAMIFGLRHFRPYLLGRKFVCRVDHMALTYYSKAVEPVGQQARHLDFIADFDFTLKYRPGTKHVNCDSLSRLRPCELNAGEPCRQCNKRIIGEHVSMVQTRAQRRAEPVVAPTTAAPELDGAGDNGPLDSRLMVDEGKIAESRSVVQTRSRTGRGGRRRSRGGRPILERTAPAAVARGIEGWNAGYLADQQLKDPDIGPALAWVGAGGRPPWDTVKSSSPALRALWQQYESLIVCDDVLYRIFHNANGTAKHYQVVLPHALKVQFLELVHADAAGHLKFLKCVSHVQRRAWWSTWRRDLKFFIQCCATCAAYHRGATPKQGPLQPMVMGAPCERWAIDLTGPFCQSNGNKYIFTAICPFSKFAVAVPIKNKEATTVAKVIMEHIFLKWGLAFEVLTDLGTEFENELASELYRLLGVRKVRSSGYRPQTNGCIENWHKILNSLLAKVVAENQRDWSEYVSYVVFCYNATEHSSTGFSPHLVMTGQQPRWNIDLLLADRPYDQFSVPQYTADLVEKLDYVHQLVRDHLEQAADSARTWYNKRVSPQTFVQGDKVRVFNPRRFAQRTPKWQSFYKDVAVVEKRLNDVTYVVSCAAWRKRRKIVHVDKLKLVKSFPDA